MLDSPVAGVRIDGGADRVGYNCTIKDNVAWKTGGYMLKGDYHNITGNLALINARTLSLDICPISSCNSRSTKGLYVSGSTNCFPEDVT